MPRYPIARAEPCFLSMAQDSATRVPRACLDALCRETSPLTGTNSCIS